jgi:Na+/melibiose symporter-like transporter
MAAVAFVIAAALQPVRAALDADRDPGAGAAGPRAVAREAAASLGLLRTDPVLRRLTLMSCGYGVAQFCFLTFFVTFQVAVLGTSLTEAGIALALGQAAGVLGRILWALVADRIGARIPLAACGVLAAVAGLVLAATGPGWPPLVVILAGMLMGATAVGWNGVMLAEAARIAAPGQVGGTTAALSFAFAVTMLVAPPSFTLLVALTGGYGAGFLLCVAAALVGAWSIATSPRR